MADLTQGPVPANATITDARIFVFNDNRPFGIGTGKSQISPAIADVGSMTAIFEYKKSDGTKGLAYVGFTAEGEPQFTAILGYVVHDVFLSKTDFGSLEGRIGLVTPRDGSLKHYSAGGDVPGKMTNHFDVNVKRYEEGKGFDGLTLHKATGRKLLDPIGNGVSAGDRAQKAAALYETFVGASDLINKERPGFSILVSDPVMGANGKLKTPGTVNANTAVTYALWDAENKGILKAGAVNDLLAAAPKNSSGKVRGGLMHKDEAQQFWRNLSDGKYRYIPAGQEGSPFSTSVEQGDLMPGYSRMPGTTRRAEAEVKADTAKVTPGPISKDIPRTETPELPDPLLSINGVSRIPKKEEQGLVSRAGYANLAAPKKKPELPEKKTAAPKRERQPAASPKKDCPTAGWPRCDGPPGM